MRHKIIASGGILTIIAIISIAYALIHYRGTAEPITIGIIHSSPGNIWSFHEQQSLEAALFTIEEINKSGGILQHTIRPIIIEADADNASSAEVIERLITQDKVSVIFSCWQSIIDPSIIAVIERHNHLLFHPGIYTGFELSPHLVCTGQTPNQQIIPGVTWCFDNIGKKFFLIGSDHIISSLFNSFITTFITTRGGTIVGQENISLQNIPLAPTIQKIIQAKPDVVINTLVGPTNKLLFEEFRKNKEMLEEIPILSFFISEIESAAIGINTIIGHYVATSYFQNVSWSSWRVNETFVTNLQKKYGTKLLINNFMETINLTINLWKNMATQAQSFNPEKVRLYLFLQPFFAPEGMIYTDNDTPTSWRFARIGKVQKDGQFFVIWETEKSAKPHPYSFYMKPQQWKQIQSQFHERQI